MEVYAEPSCISGCLRLMLHGINRLSFFGEPPSCKSSYARIRRAGPVVDGDQPWQHFQLEPCSQKVCLIAKSHTTLCVPIKLGIRDSYYLFLRRTFGRHCQHNTLLRVGGMVFSTLLATYTKASALETLSGTTAMLKRALRRQTKAGMRQEQVR